MPAAAIVGAAVLGAAGTAYSVNQQKKAAKDQERRIRQQEEQAKTEAREAALLDAARDKGGADIKLGREKSVVTTTAAPAAPAAATTRTGAVAGRVGGVGGQQSTGGNKRVGGFLLNPSKAARRLGF